MALLPQNPREQRLAVIGIIGIVGLLAYWQLLWSDTDAQLTKVQTCVDSLDSTNVRDSADLSKLGSQWHISVKTAPAKMKVAANESARELDVLRKLVPTQNEVPVLLNQVSTAARQAGLELAEIAPDGVMAGDNFDMYKFKLGVTGPYHQIAAFLTNIGSLQRIVVPINLSLLPSARPGEKKAGPNERLLDAKFDFKTYVTRVARPAPPAAPVAPGDSVNTCVKLLGPKP